MRFGSIKYLLTFGLFFGACHHAESQKNDEQSTQEITQKAPNLSYTAPSKKINGVNFSAPPRPIDNTWTTSLQQINASWVALVPYAFSRPNTPQVNYEAGRQYWGESLEGVKSNIEQAHQSGLKVMLKPQIWTRGWIGDFDLTSEEDWKIWEADYEKYLMQFAELGAKENAEMICIGTELRIAVKKRPQFWLKLIEDIRKVYHGKLTYCANWDDYRDVKFWNSLDCVGISAYFPLSAAQTPTVAELLKDWKPVKAQLKKFCEQEGKPILFAEYGYRSMDQAAWRSWEMEYQNPPVNLSAQANAYQALYQTFWKENWFAGGFAWKWYSSFRRMDPLNNHDWTPQNKPAEKIMKAYFGK